MIFRVFAAALLATGVLVVVPHAGALVPSGQVEFRAHDIEAKFPGGYSVAAVDASGLRRPT